MAIVPSLPGFEVVVRVNGVALQEHRDVYEAEPDTRNRITRYVQATSGARFDILFSRQQYFQLPIHDIGADIFLDGHCIKRPLFQTQSLRSPDFKSKIDHCHEGSNGNFKARPFMFAELDIIDSAPVEQGLSAEQAGDLGEIRVELHYKQVLFQLENPSFHVDMHHIGKISEKALKGKAISHAARLGDGEVAAQPKVFHTTYVYDQNNPFAIFKFKYRSLEALKASCVIPRSPTPESLDDRPESDLDTDELRELLRRERERNAAMKRERSVKRERANDDDSDVELLQQRPAKFQKPVQTVDLTGDSDGDE